MNLELLSRKRRYWQEDAPDWVRKIWPRPESFNYFVKHHKDTLTGAGALIKIGRDFFVETDRFPDAAAEIMGLSGAMRGEITDAP